MHCEAPNAHTHTHIWRHSDLERSFTFHHCFVFVVAPGSCWICKQSNAVCRRVDVPSRNNKEGNAVFLHRWEEKTRILTCAFGDIEHIHWTCFSEKPVWAESPKSLRAGRDGQLGVCCDLTKALLPSAQKSIAEDVVLLLLRPCLLLWYVLLFPEESQANSPTFLLSLSFLSLSLPYTHIQTNHKLLLRCIHK